MSAGTYRAIEHDGRWHVLFVRPDQPDWWQRVASFTSQDRAEDYVECENLMVRDFPEDPHRHDDVKASVPDAGEPESGIKPSALAPLKALPAPACQEEPEAPQPSAEESREWAKLPVITRVYRSLKQLGPRAANTEIGKVAWCSPNSISTHLGTLERQGLVKREGGNRHRVIKLLHPEREPVTTASEPGKPQRRFTDHRPLAPELVKGLAEDHPAVTESRTLFPTTVVNPADSPDRLLVSGKHSRKIGDRVTKGPWSGMPIYTLTLEERATCPKSCHHWGTCYGNAMPQSRRHAEGQALMDRLTDEVVELSKEHPEGFVVRLHVLGDFWSTDYVEVWRNLLRWNPPLHVFGYTAWPIDSEIGKAVALLREEQWDRFAIRTSSAQAGPTGATTIWTVPEGPRVDQGIVCPAQTGRTDCCGSCGLCWIPAAKEQCIVFVAHGMKGRQSMQPAKARKSNGPVAPSGRARDVYEALKVLPADVSNVDICAETGLVDPAAVSYELSKLELAGFIARHGHRSSRTIELLRGVERNLPEKAVPVPPIKTPTMAPSVAPYAPADKLLTYLEHCAERGRPAPASAAMLSMAAQIALQAVPLAVQRLKDQGRVELVGNGAAQSYRLKDGREVQVEGA